MASVGHHKSMIDRRGARGRGRGRGTRDAGLDCREAEGFVDAGEDGGVVVVGVDAT